MNFWIFLFGMLFVKRFEVQETFEVAEKEEHHFLNESDTNMFINSMISGAFMNS